MFAVTQIPPSARSLQQALARRSSYKYLVFSFMALENYEKKKQWLRNDSH